MKNNYCPQTTDLDIFFEGKEDAQVKSSPLEDELTEWGKSLGKKLIVKYQESKELGDGINVNFLKSHPEGGWNETTGVEVTLNERAHSHLMRYGQVGCRIGSESLITIYSPDSKASGDYILLVTNMQKLLENEK